MEGLAQNKRTANHVKRVSCRSYSFTNLPVISLVVVICFTPPAQCGDISCQGIRYTYFNKGLDTSHIPAVPQQGIHLKICPRGVTCCTPDMETKLWTLARETYSQALAASTAHLQATFNAKSRKFDDFFTELLAHSKRDFHFMFKKTYGILYERNSDVFTDFFKDLEAYYENGNVDLEDALQKFFSQLYQRMFSVLNSQYSFDSKYLQCVSKNMKKLQPFGDVPKKLTLQLRRSFVATRTFSQALQEGKKVLAKILKIAPKDKCVEALTKMTSCPACQGLPAIRPCSPYCQNVMKGCLAYHAELEDSWDKYLDNLIAVGERLIGPFNIEAVVEPIDIKISDAIMNFQESGYEVTQKVFQDCGQPRMGKRQAFGFGVQQLASVVERKPNSAAGTNLDHLVTDIISKLKETRGFWTRLPEILCQNPEVGSGSEAVTENCWTGRERGSYTGRLAGDGLAAQEQNPEVEVDSSRPDTDINQQIFSLKLASNKLENAYNGHSVEWPHYEPKYPNDSGYYGSGDVSDDCYDDEDCFSEGSGSGEKAGESGRTEPEDSEDYDNEGSGGYNSDNLKEEEDNFEPKWPPWVMTKSSTASPDRDIVIEDRTSSLNPPQFSGGVPTVSVSLVMFLLPVTMTQLGALLTC